MAEPAVRIEIPASGEYLAVLRAAASGLAAGLSFTYEEIDDLRIAVDELCFAVMGEEGSTEPLTLVYQIHPGAVSVSGSCAAQGPGPVQSELSRTIVAAVADEHELGQRDGVRCFRVLKRGTVQEANAPG